VKRPSTAFSAHGAARSRPRTRWVVLTGASCSGKSTLLERLHQFGYPVMRETARGIFSAERDRADSDVRQHRRAKGLQLSLIAAKRDAEAKLDPSILTFLDRALPDSIAFWLSYGYDAAEIWDLCAIRDYAAVFLLERLPLVNDGVRCETEPVRTTLETKLKWVYRRLGYRTRFLPVFSCDPETSLKLRISFVLKVLGITPSEP